MNAITSAATHWCQVGDAFVFLDLRRARYFMMDRDAADRFAAIRGASANIEDEAWLVERNLQNLEPPVSRSFPDRVVPDHSLLDDDVRATASIADMANATLSLLRAQRDVRRKPLAKILANFSHVGPASEQVQQRHAQRATAAFQRARHYVSGIDECLSRGVAMRRFLAGRGCEARLVIGVTLPFAAHCWVQLGSAVLTDQLDVVAPYQPILVA